MKQNSFTAILAGAALPLLSLVKADHPVHQEIGHRPVLSSLGARNLLARQNTCPIMRKICDGEFCIPVSGQCCNSGEGGFCDIGSRCDGGGCCPLGRTCSGPPTGCRDGRELCNDYCVPEGSVCCPDKGFCEAGQRCIGDGFCSGLGGASQPPVETPTSGPPAVTSTPSSAEASSTTSDPITSTSTTSDAFASPSPSETDSPLNPPPRFPGPDDNNGDDGDDNNNDNNNNNDGSDEQAEDGNNPPASAGTLVSLPSFYALVAAIFAAPLLL